jgi:kynurenine formamidase
MGWDTIADDRDAYVEMPVPGPELDVAEHLAEIGVVSTGSDTMPYEAAPGDVPLAVHVALIPKSGIFIYEMLDLRELAATGVHEFLFIAAPLRLRGGTGSPINPLAVLA